MVPASTDPRSSPDGRRPAGRAAATRARGAPPRRASRWRRRAAPGLARAVALQFDADERDAHLAPRTCQPRRDPADRTDDRGGHDLGARLAEPRGAAFGTARRLLAGPADRAPRARREPGDRRRIPLAVSANRADPPGQHRAVAAAGAVSGRGRRSRAGRADFRGRPARTGKRIAALSPRPGPADLSAARAACVRLSTSAASPRAIPRFTVPASPATSRLMHDLVSTAWLAERLAEPDLVVIDASAHLPDAGRNAREEFEYSHVPGA